MSIKNLHLPEDEKTRRRNQFRVCLRGNYRKQWGKVVVPEDRLVEILEQKGEARKIHEMG